MARVVDIVPRNRYNGKNLNFYKSTGEVGIMARGIGIMARGVCIMAMGVGKIARV